MTSQKSPARYDFKAIEQKWQKRWSQENIYECDTGSRKPKYYTLEMFPYPSGDGLSVGHFHNYIPVDAVTRYKRMNGFEVLHPMGWDAFGLPAEQDAIDKGRHPAESTLEYAANYKRQLNLVGCGHDWTREINSSTPAYYRWTQWMFLLLHKRGLAYRTEKMQWWCDTCGALADEEVLADGTDWRGHSGVYKKPLMQWFFKITEYADRLIDDLDDLDWPEPTKRMQTNWVGRSEGADVLFKTENNNSISVFTTRPDTLFGATFLVLAPEHPLVDDLTTEEHCNNVKQYIDRASTRSEIERTSTANDKTGVFTGSYAINPVNDEKIPIWVADYVLASYGSGAIMAVPAHDARDFAFAQKYNLNIHVVISPPDWDDAPLTEAYVGPGQVVNSSDFSGLTSAECQKQIVAKLEANGQGNKSINYKLRDWLISRQRYWGCPIPIVHCPDCGEVPVPEKNLPVILPHITDFTPDPTVGSPLKRVDDWVNTTCPECGKSAERETDTLGGFACSSWYYLRFISPSLANAPFDRKDAEKWMPVDLYVGGAEHSVMHLLYARFWFKVMYDAGLISYKEPFTALRHQGMILAQDGWVKNTDIKVVSERASANSPHGVDVFLSPEAGSKLLYHAGAKAEFDISGPSSGGWTPIRSGKMSKSMGNVVTPDSVVDKFGADCLRGLELFMAPMEATLPWNENGLNGIARFYNKIWGLVTGEFGSNTKSNISLEQARTKATQVANQAVKKCTNDMESLRFNTMVANGLMEPVNDLAAIWSTELANTHEGREALEKIILLMSPVAPHLAEELWERMGHTESVILAKWPDFDPSLTQDQSLFLVIQVNGKVRDRIEVEKGIVEEDATSLALKMPNIIAHLDGKTVIRTIFVKDKLLNFVVN